MEANLKRVIANEAKLDEAQAIIYRVIKDIRNNLKDYKAEDLWQLEQVYYSLDKVTLRQDV